MDLPPFFDLATPLMEVNLRFGRHCFTRFFILNGFLDDFLVVAYDLCVERNWRVNMESSEKSN